MLMFKSTFISILFFFQQLNNSQLSTLNFQLKEVHAYHNSIAEMRLNSKDKIYEVEIKVYTDDFEKALEKENKSKVKIAENDKNDALILKYLQKHFVVNNTKNQLKPYNYLGKQIENDATWLIVELPANEPINGYKIQYDVLTEFYDDQINMLNIILPTERKSYLFNVKTRVQSVL